MTTLAEHIVRYDQLIFSPQIRELYGGADFYNVGYWGHAQSLPQACRALVDLHIDAVAAQAAAAPRRILDLGCGLGAGTEQIARRFGAALTLGAGLSRAQLQHARAQHPAAVYCAMDATHLALHDATFDALISVEAAFHFAPRRAFLEAAYRLLRPGGCVVLTDILFRTTNWLAGWSVPPANMLSDLAAYRAMCVAAGFAIAGIDDITEATWLGFCRHLRTEQHSDRLAEHLEQAVLAYFLVRLQKA